MPVDWMIQPPHSSARPPVPTPSIHRPSTISLATMIPEAGLIAPCLGSNAEHSASSSPSTSGVVLDPSLRAQPSPLSRVSVLLHWSEGCLVRFLRRDRGVKTRVCRGVVLNLDLDRKLSVYHGVADSTAASVFNSRRASADSMAERLATDMANMGMTGTGALVVAHGELLIDFVPTVAGVSLAEAPAFKKAPGGAPANVAVGVARLGGNAAFIGKVGDDEFGHMLAEVLETNKVNVKGLCFDSHARTALAFVTLKKCGEREFMFFRNPSADMLMVPAELDENLIRQSGIFHYGSISLISEPSRSTHMAAMKLARESGSLMSYDPNLRLPLWPSPEAAREGILSIWKEADIIKVSDEEVKFLTNGGDDKLDQVVMTLWHDKLKLLLVTDGPDGCRYYTPGFKGRVNSFTVATIDTTGAGDAFVAGLLHRLANNKNLLSDETALQSALHFACACGAITTTERGAIPAMPDMPAAMKFMAGNMAV